MQEIFAAHGFDLFAPDIDAARVVATHTEIGAEPEITQPVGVDAHGFDGDAVGGDEIGGGDRDPGSNGGSGGWAIALHAFVAVYDGRPPVRLQRLSAQENVVVGLPQTVVDDALVVPAA